MGPASRVVVSERSVVVRGGLFFFFTSRRRHTILVSDWSSDVCSSDLSARLSPRGRKNLPTATTESEQYHGTRDPTGQHFLGCYGRLVWCNRACGRRRPCRRSEERRVGEGWRGGGGAEDLIKKRRVYRA